jgi:hypothetical protein
MATPILAAICRFLAGRSVWMGKGGKPNAAADTMHWISQSRQVNSRQL